MQIGNRESSPRYVRDGIESFLLLSLWSSNARRLSLTLVEMQEKGTQKPHRHSPEQAYYILEGKGLMQVGNAQEPVKAGDCIFIPSNETHGLVNNGDGSLRYLSACSPGFTKKQCEQWWPLPSREES